jgi:YidC/Oxa1 family membrane protein insertase
MMHTRRIGAHLLQRVASTTKTNIALSYKPLNFALQTVSIRSFSDRPSSNDSNSTDFPASTDFPGSSFEVPNPSTLDAVQSVVDEKVMNAATAVGSAEGPNMVAGKIMEIIDGIHNFVGIPYWEAIIIATIATRVLILPIAIKTVQGAARMAAMKPEMQRIQDAMTKDADFEDTKIKLRYQAELQALFKKHKVHPLRAVMWPFAQFPIFIAFFMALKDMGMYYPGFATGGAFWFENLAIADPYYALPVINALSFLVMIEIGSGDGVDLQQQSKFKNIMRGLAIFMVPFTASMPQVRSIFFFYIFIRFFNVVFLRFLSSSFLFLRVYSGFIRILGSE